MISFEDFKKIDLRIAEVVSVEEHPNADKLYVIQLSLGDEKKQIVAGIRNNYSMTELIGKKVVVVNNLDPVVIRGEESNGMLLAAGSENGPVILMPEKDVVAGTVIG
ncbi:MAG: methionine--tRNA ligase subunit beta [Candidatus Omnitrophota bacterium]